jgi:hypothetical protein
LLALAMKPSVECRKLAALLREKAKTAHDAELRAEYEYLVRGFSRLAKQFEQGMDANKVTDQRDRNTAA